MALKGLSGIMRYTFRRRLGGCLNERGVAGAVFPNAAGRSHGPISLAQIALLGQLVLDAIELKGA